MAFITIFDEAPTGTSAGWNELAFFTEDTTEGAMLTVVGRHSDIVRWLATTWAPDDDLGLAFLVSEIQLEDEAMDEHNVARGAINL